MRSLAEALLMASSGKATSMNFFLIFTPLRLKPRVRQRPVTRASARASRFHFAAAASAAGVLAVGICARAKSLPRGKGPPITNAWIASPPVRNQRRPRPKPAPGKTATPPRRIKNALSQERSGWRIRLAYQASSSSGTANPIALKLSSWMMISFILRAPLGGSKSPLLGTIRRLRHRRPRPDPNWRGGHTP